MNLPTLQVSVLVRLEIGEADHDGSGAYRPRYSSHPLSEPIDELRGEPVLEEEEVMCPHIAGDDDLYPHQPYPVERKAEVVLNLLGDAEVHVLPRSCGQPPRVGRYAGALLRSFGRNSSPEDQPLRAVNSQ